MITLYDIKPYFQKILHPVARYFAGKRFTANQVTVSAAAGSLVLGYVLCRYHSFHQLFLLLPFWMFLRMALNAIDGMMAREFNQQSKLGAYLNEICDVVSDAALFVPFALIEPFTFFTVGLVIFLATVSELAGVLGLTVGSSRRYDGPLGKSDRALIFGALGFWVGLGGEMAQWLYWLMPILAVLVVLTIYNRVKQGLKEGSSSDNWKNSDKEGKDEPDRSPKDC